MSGPRPVRSSTPIAPATLGLLLHEPHPDAGGRSRTGGWASGEWPARGPMAGTGEEQCGQGLRASHREQCGDPRPTPPATPPRRPQDAGHHHQHISCDQGRDDPTGNRGRRGRRGCRRLRPWRASGRRGRRPEGQGGGPHNLRRHLLGGPLGCGCSGCSRDHRPWRRPLRDRRHRAFGPGLGGRLQGNRSRARFRGRLRNRRRDGRGVRGRRIGHVGSRLSGPFP